jgi:hypothetical protein
VSEDSRPFPNDFESGFVSEASKHRPETDALIVAVARAKDEQSTRSILYSLLFDWISSVGDMVLAKMKERINLPSEVVAGDSMTDRQSFIAYRWIA